MFLLVVEGLNGEIRSAEDINLYSRFKIGNSAFQFFIFSTLMILSYWGNQLYNLWSLKAILRCFELASGLKIYIFFLSKINVFGVNVSSEFLGVAVRFLYCSEVCLPFKYLGLPMGKNLRQERTWIPLIDTLTRRLYSWGNRFVSLGGRVSLLNSGLIAIPMLYLT